MRFTLGYNLGAYYIIEEDFIKFRIYFSKQLRLKNGC